MTRQFKPLQQQPKEFKDFSGRPVPILYHGEPIRELV